MNQTINHRRIFKSGAIILMALLFVWVSASFAEETAESEWVTGYFTKNSVLKKEKVPSSENLEWFPAFQPITVHRLDHIWGEYTSESGNYGYVYIQMLKPLPEVTPVTPYNVYTEEREPLRTMPEYEDRGTWLEPWTLLTVDGVCGKFARVTTPDGEKGFMYEEKLRKAEFAAEEMTPVRFCVGEKVTGCEMPLKGSKATITLMPGTVYTADRKYGEYYALKIDGVTGYIRKSETRQMTVYHGNERIFFSGSGGNGEENGPREVYDYGQIVGDGGEMLLDDGSTEKLPANEFVYLYSEYSGFYGAARGSRYGYIRTSGVRAPAGTEGVITVERNPLLDTGFAMLEQGNPFLRRYNEATGAGVTPVLKLGIPYFWGGRNYETVLERQPEYTTREAWQSSRVYFNKGTIYVSGFDCIGLIKQVYKGAGKPIEGNVSDLGGGYLCVPGSHVWCSRHTPLPEDWREVARNSRVGDIWLIHHPGTHAMMYIGTLRDYGYTEQDLPGMASLLDYPLFLQSGDNPAYYERFKDLIANRKNDRIGRAVTTCGGASVCILGADEAIPDYVAAIETSTYRCFEVEGSCVTVMPYDNIADYFVYRYDVE